MEKLSTRKRSKCPRLTNERTSLFPQLVSQLRLNRRRKENLPRTTQRLEKCPKRSPSESSGAFRVASRQLRPAPTLQLDYRRKQRCVNLVLFHSLCHSLTLTILINLFWALARINIQKKSCTKEKKLSSRSPESRTGPLSCFASTNS